ncbi:MAG: DUF4349 domain-containing protein [Bacillota bacterium]|nr:DUF4349 domain-containing protein [Eubacteriales bacterium]MDD4285514.1 DUF4349 domain-containing protein [Eubacteriales bacterium]MDI9492361.1 DUF4349 domain-containing protein [Bacillota bacterium]NLV69546.1 DUF4349 domain-containing protein [Clostridiales bacterium]
MFQRDRYKRKAASAICMLLLALTLLGGCGGASNQVAEDRSTSSSYDMGSAEPGSGFGADGLEYKSEAEAGQAAAPDASAAFRRYGENVKLVYTAQMRLQTTDFEKAESELTALVNSLGGYFEYSHVDRGGYDSDGTRIYGSYTVRVPAEKYESFLSTVSDACHVVSLDRSVTDIGMEYFDAETRLNTLRTKMERLTALLERADAMSDIIELENSIANTQYEIDWHTSTLNRYDSLVGYSTVNISLEQVARLSGGVDDAEGFFPSLFRNLKEGIGHFVDSLEKVVFWMAYNLVALAILAVLLILGCKCYRKHRPDKHFSLQAWRQDRKTRKARKAAEQAEHTKEDR